jgi:hypothetical protein
MTKRLRQHRPTKSISVSYFLLILISYIVLSHGNLAPHIHGHAIEGPHQHSQSSSVPSSHDSDSGRGEDASLPAPDRSLGRLRFARIAWGLDKAYVTATYMGAPHFRHNGWGFNPLSPSDAVLRDLRARVAALVTRADPHPIRVDWDGGEGAAPRLLEGVLVRDGSFHSPAAAALPPPAQTARFRAVWPASGTAGCPMLVLLPPNGDEDYSRRFRDLARSAAAAAAAIGR